MPRLEGERSGGGLLTVILLIVLVIAVVVLLEYMNILNLIPNWP